VASGAPDERATDFHGSRWLAPGRSLLRWADRHELWRPNHPLVSWIAISLLAIAFLVTKLAPSPWLIAVVVILLLFEIFVKYLDQAAADVDRELREDVWNQIMRLNERVTGNVAVIMDHCSARSRRAIDHTEYRERLRGLQQHLLGHIVDVLNHKLNLPPDSMTLSANWAVRGEGEHADQFQVLRYDRNMPDRRVRSDRWHPIADGLPGASEAFERCKTTLVPDTHDEDLSTFFPERPAYRSILSVPVETNGEIIGVVNIDSDQPEVLRVEHATLVWDVAYLIGLCQVLERSSYASSNH